MYHGHEVTIHFIVNDILMCAHFGLAIKEICGCFQPGGQLYSHDIEVMKKKVLHPLIVVIGGAPIRSVQCTSSADCLTGRSWTGVFGPVLVFFALLRLLHAGDAGTEAYEEMSRGWGIPTATDVSLAWATSALVFGKTHPAVNYLLVIMALDDAAVVCILAIFYGDPDRPFHGEFLIFVGVAMLIACQYNTIRLPAVARHSTDNAVSMCTVIERKLQVETWWVYICTAGPFSWFGLINADMHPALCLAFVMPFIPAQVESHRGRVRYPLEEFSNAMQTFVEVFVMFFFGLVNGGVSLTEVRHHTFPLRARLRLTCSMIMMQCRWGI